MRKLFIISAITILALAIVSCGNTNPNGKKASKETVSLTGAGATFPLPFYNLAFKTYTKAGNELVTYGGIGSGGGIRSLNDRIVDFGATDAYLSDKKMGKMPMPIVHIPTCMGAVVVAFNVDGVKDLKLSQEVLADIFLGKIKKWNDARIKKINPSKNLPSMDITVVHRSDGSGTTYVFSNYLSKISSEWSNKIGFAKSLQWPTGIAAKGNPGVAGSIAQTKGSIGYIGSEYAFSLNIPAASLQNKSGRYIKASLESISKAASAKIPEDTRVMLTDSEAADAYPIACFTWIIIYKEQSYKNRSLKRAKTIVKMLNWMLDDKAQSMTSKVHYAPLPTTAREYAKNILKHVTYDGKSVIK